MATTFVKVDDCDKIHELWRAGLLWRKQPVHVEGMVIPEVSHVIYSGDPNSFFMARWWTDYGYMVED